ncbi:helix-hairpin-helix domain-containing protein [Isoptericola aurantiacus]|uniref:helix-hairpin-helix domain-containing protein n=1 Tax=Isoptericola aurantiacus TaxID=3377839 RepID=UPI00383B2F19
MTTTSPPPDPTADRLRALREALAQEEAADTGVRSAAHDHAPSPAAVDELVDRLARRRSASHVAAAYSAAHGHPLEHAAPDAPRRWAVSGPTALAAAGALLLVALVVVAIALWPDPGAGDVEPLGISTDVPVDDGVEVSAQPDGRPSAGTPAAGGGASTAGADESAASTDAGPTAGPELVMHVVGEVREPGLVRLPAGSRVADAIEAAGGFTRDADTTVLNLARTVVDGEQVHVPAPGEELPDTPDAAAGTPAASDAVPAPIPLNSADAATLATLPGIGPVLAERIVAWRDEHGPFTAFEELQEVSGIGPVLLGDLRDLVLV